MTKRHNKTEGVRTHNKTEAELRQELELKAHRAFLEEVNEALKPIMEKHSRMLVPVLNNMSNEHKFHIEAGFSSQRFVKQEIKTEIKDAPLETKPETNGQPDSND